MVADSPGAISGVACDVHVGRQWMVTIVTVRIPPSLAAAAAAAGG